MKSIVAMAAGAGLLITGCGGAGGDDDPYRNVVSDKRAPEVTVTIRDDAGGGVADIAYDAVKGRIPMRGTYAFLQTVDDGTWSTAYTLHGNDVIDGVPGDFEDNAFAGPGPDTHRLPDLDADDTYRICVEFVVGHPARNAIGCSTGFPQRLMLGGSSSAESRQRASDQPATSNTDRHSYRLDRVHRARVDTP